MSRCPSDWPIVEFEAFGGVDVIVRECPATGQQREFTRWNGFCGYLDSPPHEVWVSQVHGESDGVRSYICYGSWPRDQRPLRNVDGGAR